MCFRINGLCMDEKLNALETHFKKDLDFVDDALISSGQGNDIHCSITIKENYISDFDTLNSGDCITLYRALGFNNDFKHLFRELNRTTDNRSRKDVIEMLRNEENGNVYDERVHYTFII